MIFFYDTVRSQLSGEISGYKSSITVNFIVRLVLLSLHDVISWIALQRV